MTELLFTNQEFFFFGFALQQDSNLEIESCWMTAFLGNQNFTMQISGGYVHWVEFPVFKSTQRLIEAQVVLPW